MIYWPWQKVTKMAKTKGGNPVIGTVNCFSPGCEETASVHQIATGSREGELYTRCPECKANQSTGRPFQKYLVENADFREGYEHLSVKPEVKETEPDEIVETERTETETDEVDQVTEKSGSGLLGAGLLVIGGLLAVIVGVKK